MKSAATLGLVYLVTVAAVCAAQGDAFVRVLRDGEQATLSAFGSRPVDLAAKRLVDEFGIAVNVEDPFYVYRGDVQDISGGPQRVLIPAASLLEIRLDLRADGSVADAYELVRALADQANSQMPFGYRVDDDGDVFTLVATRTGDEHGRSVDLVPLLDRRVTIPVGTRKIIEHVNLITRSLRHQTGVSVECCQAAVSGIPWGSTVTSFGADDEPARSALLRLLRREPGRDHLVHTGPNDGFHLKKADPKREHWHWLLRCQPSEASCFISVAPIPQRP